MSKINDFLTETGVFFMATEDGDQPKIRPLGAHLEMDGKVLFGVGDFKDVYRQMKENPQVEIVACKQDGHWLRYTGTAVFETDGKYAEAMLDAAPQLREMYNEKTGNKMAVFHIENAKAPVELLGMQVIDELIQGEVSYYKGIYDEKGIKGLLGELQ